MQGTNLAHDSREEVDLKTRVYVWTRRVGIFAMVTGFWDAAHWIGAWSEGVVDPVGDLSNQLMRAGIGLLIWYRLRNTEDQARAKTTTG